MKLTREMVERALKQHDKLVELGVRNTGQSDMYETTSLHGSVDTWGDYDSRPNGFLL